MTEITPDAVRAAADVLGISDRASITEIRSRYRALVKEWHPDVSEREPDETHQEMVRLNDAYGILMRYCLQVQISFRPEDLHKVTGGDPLETWMAQYGDDPIWGPRRPPSDRSG